jgi:hypothetical protein
VVAVSSKVTGFDFSPVGDGAFVDNVSLKA